MFFYTIIFFICVQGVKFDPDLPQTIRLEFAKSNTKVSKPKQQSPPAATALPHLIHPLTGRKCLVKTSSSSFLFFIFYYILSTKNIFLSLFAFVLHSNFFPCNLSYYVELVFKCCFMASQMPFIPGQGIDQAVLLANNYLN